MVRDGRETCKRYVATTMTSKPLESEMAVGRRVCCAIDNRAVSYNLNKTHHTHIFIPVGLHVMHHFRRPTDWIDECEERRKKTKIFFEKRDDIHHKQKSIERIVNRESINTYRAK
jgi:hypothetical protein